MFQAQKNSPYPNNVVVFTSDQHGHFNVEFQSHDDATSSRTSAKRRRRKPPFLVSIVPPSSVNGSTMQTSTSRSSWPTHNNGRLAEHPRISEASCLTVAKPSVSTPLLLALFLLVVFARFFSRDGNCRVCYRIFFYTISTLKFFL